MTWNLTKGRGTIKGEERLLYSRVISEMTTETLYATNGEFCAGVGVFDSIPSCGKLLMLEYVQHHLFEKTKEQTGLQHVMGMPPSYFDSIPVKEPNATKMVEIIQRLVKLPSKAFEVVRGIKPNELDF